MSQRIFGIGIVSVGLLILTVALILGLEFPQYVFRQNVEVVCILDEDHEHFREWEEDTRRVKHNKVYYWVITNKDEFLYHQKAPKIEEKGPYIYLETIRRIDIRFVMSTVQFVEWKRQTFDQQATRKVCPNCTEEESLTVVNPHFLQMVEEFEGDVQYTLHATPAFLASAINEIRAQDAAWNVADVMAALGDVSETDSLTARWRQQLNFPEDFAGLGFGNWVGQRDTAEKRAILLSRRDADFTSTEMTGLYFALTNTDSLGASKNALTNETFRVECQDHNIVPSYATDQIDIDPNTLEEAPDNVVVTAVKDAISVDQAPCGLVYHLRHYLLVEETATDQLLFNITDSLGQYLCPNESTACWSLPVDLTTRKLYVRALADYVLRHLMHFVFHKAVILAEADLVTTKSQRDLTLGYNKVWPSSTGVNGTVTTRVHFVPGTLEHAKTAAEARRRSKQIVLLNCYDSINAETNFMWRAYDRKTHSSEEQFPAASSEERAVRSARHNLQPLSDLKACSSYDVPEELSVFVPEFWRKILFTRIGESSLEGVSLDKLQFNASNLEQDEIFVFSAGLQDMTRTNGYVSWISLPHFLHSTEPLVDGFVMRPTEEQHSSFVEWEAMGGEMWISTLRHQHNVGVLRRDTLVQRSKALSLTYFDDPIPVFWLEQHFRQSSRGVRDFKHRVTRLMEASCGGLVGLSVVAALTMLVGLLAGTVSIRSGKVAPMSEDMLS